MQKPIPSELLDQATRGNVLLFVGEQVTRDDVDGQNIYERMRIELSGLCGIDLVTNPTFSQLAEEFVALRGRSVLLQFIRERLGTFAEQPQAIHHLIANLTSCKVLVTTCLDNRLERALATAKRPLNVLTSNIDLAFTDEHKAQLYRLRGSLERTESLVLTDMDHEQAYSGQDTLSFLLCAELTRKTILFIGYDFTDMYFRGLYNKIMDPLGSFARQAYALFNQEPTRQILSWCESRNIKILSTDVADFLGRLASQLAVDTNFDTVAHDDFVSYNDASLHSAQSRTTSIPVVRSSQNRQHLERNTIFISYSHVDKRWMDRLMIHLRPLVRDDNLKVWNDTMIDPGSNWREEIDKALKAAKVALLLVSADFLASDFIARNELPPLLKAAQEEGAVIMPVIIGHCRFVQTKSVSQFQSVNSPSQPLEGLSPNKRNAILLKVTEAVEKAL